LQKSSIRERKTSAGLKPVIVSEPYAALKGRSSTQFPALVGFSTAHGEFFSS